MKILVTGAAGFIGFFTAQRLLDRGDEVIGLDNLNSYYDVSLKLARLEILQRHKSFRFSKLDLEDQAAMAALFAAENFDRVIHLAAQAGVRHSLTHPFDYIASNITGTLAVLEGCRNNNVKHLVYASSSSVYGASTRMPFSVHESACHPISLYAASKRSTELMAHSYSALFGLPTTGLRFFTVYGPWGRPDMALFRFARAILQEQPIELYNFGNHNRDFTYIDDIVDALVRITDHTATPNSAWDSVNADPSSSKAPYRLYNIGSNRPIKLLRYIELLEDCFKRKAQKILLPLQPGDVPDTFADVSELIADIHYQPQTPVEKGINNFVTWFKSYYDYG